MLKTRSAKAHRIIGFRVLALLTMALLESASGEVKSGRGFLGFGWQAMIAPDGVHALRVLNVVADSPAKKAGLLTEDVAVTINGKAVSLPSNWQSGPIESPFESILIGDQVALKVRRGGKELELIMTAIEDPRTSTIVAAERAAMQRYDANRGLILVSSMMERRERIVLRRTAAGLLQVVQSQLAAEDLPAVEKALNGPFSDLFKSLAVGEHELELDERLTPLPFRTFKVTPGN